MFKTKDINDFKVKPIIHQQPYNKNTVRAYDLFAEPYSNIALIAKKKSGKTVCITRSLEKCCSKKTNVIIFASTVNIDPTYKKCVAMLENKGCNVQTYENFIEGKVNILEQFVDILQKKDEPEPEPDLPKKMPLCLFTGKELDPPKKKKVPKPEKLLTPEYVIVIDDLSNLCRDNSIYRLLNRNRHYKCKIFLSLHSVSDLTPSALNMIDVFLCFPNISDDRIEELGEKTGIHFKSDTKKRRILQELYDEATKEKYNFLYIDKGRMEFRHNFNKRFKIPE